MPHQISETLSTVEVVASAIMTLEPDDLAGRALVQQALEQTRDQLQDSRPLTSRLAGGLALAADSERAAWGDPGEALNTLIGGIAALQSMVRAYERGQPETAGEPAVIQAVALLAQVDPETLTERRAASPTDPPGRAAAKAATDEVEVAEGELPVVQGEDSGGIPADDPDARPAAVDDLASALEQVAQDTLTVSLDDLSELGKIHSQMEEIGQRLKAEQTAARSLTESLAAVIEQIIFDECDDREAAVTVVGDGMSMLRDLHSAFTAEGSERIDDSELLERICTLAGSSTGAESEELAPPDVAEDQEVETPAPSEPVVGSVDGTGGDDMMEAAPEAGPQSSCTPVEVDADIFSDFTSEADEHLSVAESTLLALESNPTDAELLNTIFRSFHTIKGAAGFLNLEDVTRVAHAIEDVLDSARKGQLALTAAITDVILASIDLLKELLRRAEEQILSGTVVPQDVSAFLARVKAAGRGEAPEPGSQTSEPVPVEAAPPAPRDGAGAEPKRRDPHVRVDTEKLDLLVNVVGELVIAQTQVGQSPDVLQSTNQKLSKDIGQLTKISGDLQEIAMSLRMVPIRATFERMARMVRDLGRKCGKQVEFRMRGEDTELDKNVVEEIVDPLTHMVRNAMDHGVESADERRAAGKPEKGQVILEACHKSGHVVIELSDDGKGINRDKVLKKAVERGLVSAESELSDTEIFNLVFHPGLSTADKITDVSGRGVGMDVVRRNIERLRGRVEVHSEVGKGSVFTIKLPLTLAIIDGMVIGVGEQRYILPLTSIVSSLRPQPEQITTVLKRGEMVRVQDELFPLVRLHERFAVEPRHTDPCSALVVLIEAEGNRCCLMVDELVGLQQVVIKGLDESLRQDPCLAGCAILGDGRVGLIMDANGLVEQALGKNKGAWEKIYQETG
jgi:two-component system, chemotaxis family, sensor kinase CheA